MKTSILILLAASVAYGQIAATNAHPRFPCVGCAVDQDHHPDLPCTDPNWVKTGTCVVVDPPQSPITSQSIPAAPATPCTLKDKNGRVLEYGVQVKEGCDLTNATPVLPAKPYDLMLECNKLPTGADHVATTGTAEHHWFMAFVEGEHQWSYDCWEAKAETKPAKPKDCVLNIPDGQTVTDMTCKDGVMARYMAQAETKHVVCPLDSHNVPGHNEICEPDGCALKGTCWDQTTPAPAAYSESGEAENMEAVKEDISALWDVVASLPRYISICGYEGPGERCVKLPDGFQLMPSLLLFNDTLF